MDADLDRIPATTSERAAWIAAVLTPLTAIGYFAVVLPQLGGQPVADIGWQAPMLWSMGINFLGTIVVTIIATIIAGIGAGLRREELDTSSDERDREIDRHGGRVALAVAAAGLLVALVLAMLEADPFWIGNAAFLLGAAGATAGAIAQVRAYRGTFRG
ncbi:hypothetical protein H4J02_03275 [Protaetiibacter sp. SSC-01]|uniref:hypothetical protein n=1 Tax=Protaetiibacter sp. SSC-01 TaxID=2759943 RepID=UPI001656937A|nr:hypothetical protein [Protaetiibacter sp. SSC-01]QNO38065.1 hypothetical protein H4J02_03275 [Protaetiibacter sp. SSC-01]